MFPELIQCSLLDELLIYRISRHLNGTVLGSFVRPAVLITDAYNALNNQGYRKKQDQDFIGT